ECEHQDRLAAHICQCTFEKSVGSAVVSEEKESLVERRMRYIERQVKIGHGVNVRFEGLKPQGSGPKNLHGMPAIPIDQHVVTNWPTLSLGYVPEISLDDWRLEIAGLVENPFTLDWKDFMALPQVEDVS